MPEVELVGLKCGLVCVTWIIMGTRLVSFHLFFSYGKEGSRVGQREDEDENISCPRVREMRETASALGWTT